MRKPIIVASVLPADFSQLGQQVKELERWRRSDLVGCDGRPIRAELDVIAASRRHTSLEFEAQLMIENPDPMLGRWVEAGCQIVIVHVEATRHLHHTLSTIRGLGVRAGVALSPPHRFRLCLTCCI